MKTPLLSILLLFFFLGSTKAQMNDYEDGFTVQDNTFNPNRALDSLKSTHKEVPKGMYVWTIDKTFGDRTIVAPDTAQHLFMNTIFTTGMYGEYNTTGNLGAPRQTRIATNRDYTTFEFADPYSYFITQPQDLRFTNTLSPITNLAFNSCGDKTNGEDHLRALFANNINKETGFGFKFDYIYGRGYYQNQSTALFDYTAWGSYIGQRYNAHLIMSFDHMKATENGGITDDEYITHPEATSETYSESEIPVLLSNNWNRTNAFHTTLSHRYNIGFYKKVPMTEMEKEARRFALKAQREKEELDAANNQGKEGPNSVRPTGGVAMGRPDNAVIMGDLPKEIIKKPEPSDSIKEIAQRPDTTAIDTSWTKEIYVPVTSFIHNLQFDNYGHTYIAYSSPTNLYLNTFSVPQERAMGDSIYDETKYFKLRNTFAVALMEGLNKYVPMGAKVFLTHDFIHYSLPEEGGTAYKSYNETTFYGGAQLIKTLGNTLHYKATGQLGLVGENVGDIRLDGEGDVRIKILKDSVTLKLGAFYHLTNPTFLQRHYHSKHFWWDHDGMSKQMQTHLEGSLTYSKTRTTLRVAYDNFQNLVYLGVAYSRSGTNVTGYKADIYQSSKNISLLTAELQQDFTLGILNWENRITFQKSSDEDIMPAPTVNVWTNLYLKFRIAKVLNVNFGADMRYFTEYYAPEYVPQLSQYAVQQNSDVKTKIGNYPLINVYCNFKLRHCRFFVMMSHVNAGSGNNNYFYTPHYPLNTRILRLGLNWTFFN